MNKIILVYYINVSGKSTMKAKQILADLSQNLIKSDDILNFIFPILSGETRVECINPKLVSGEEFENALDILTNNQKIVSDLLESLNKEL